MNIEYKTIKRKPVEFEAVQVTKELLEGLYDKEPVYSSTGTKPFYGSVKIFDEWFRWAYGNNCKYIELDFCNPSQQAQIGDWIVKDNGKVRIIRAGRFKKMYETL